MGSIVSSAFARYSASAASSSWPKAVEGTNASARQRSAAVRDCDVMIRVARA